MSGTHQSQQVNNENGNYFGYQYGGNRSYNRDGPIANRIFVGGLPNATTENELRNYFSSNGAIVRDVKVIHDRTNNNAKGYGFVTFDSEDMAKNVLLRKEAYVFKSRKLNIAQAVRKLKPYGQMQNSGYPVGNQNYYGVDPNVVYYENNSRVPNNANLNGTDIINVNQIPYGCMTQFQDGQFYVPMLIPTQTYGFLNTNQNGIMPQSPYPVNIPLSPAAPINAAAPPAQLSTITVQHGGSKPWVTQPQNVTADTRPSSSPVNNGAGGGASVENQNTSNVSADTNETNSASDKTPTSTLNNSTLPLMVTGTDINMATSSYSGGCASAMQNSSGPFPGCLSPYPLSPIAIPMNMPVLVSGPNGPYYLTTYLDNNMIGESPVRINNPLPQAAGGMKLFQTASTPQPNRCDTSDMTSALDFSQINISGDCGAQHQWHQLYSVGTNNENNSTS